MWTKITDFAYFPNFKQYFINECRQDLPRAGFPDVGKQPKDCTKIAGKLPEGWRNPNFSTSKRGQKGWDLWKEI